MVFFADHEHIVAEKDTEIERLKVRSHKWTGRRLGGDPSNAESYEWVRFCDYCGIEDTCEEGIPECGVTRESLLAENASLKETIESREKMLDKLDAGNLELNRRIERLSDGVEKAIVHLAAIKSATFVNEEVDVLDRLSDLQSELVSRFIAARAAKEK